MYNAYYAYCNPHTNVAGICSCKWSIVCFLAWSSLLTSIWMPQHLFPPLAQVCVGMHVTVAQENNAIRDLLWFGDCKQSLLQSSFSEEVT